jgi:radical SAM superfamily enzyme YgiQ (UPF0313 family)
MKNVNKTVLVAINAKYVHTNIAVRYISRYCNEHGVFCDFAEYTINEPKSNVLAKLYSMQCDAYGFSCYIWNIDYVLSICQSLKMLRPERKIFLGGPEVSFDAEDILKKHQFIDCIVCGEGEAAVCELLLNLPEDRRVVYGEKAKDMDDLPFPYTEEDIENIVQSEKLVYYETSRGCPFSCAYCLSSIEMGVRFLSTERAKKEIEFMTKKGVQTIKFVDRTFNADPKRAMEIWKHCISLKSNTCYHFEIGADLLTNELIDLLKNAKEGQIQFEIGVQTTNMKTISEISRRMDLEVLSKNVRRLREETNVILHLDLIAGLPMEDFMSFGNSFNDVYNLHPHVLQLGFLKLLKGSPLRKDFTKYQMMFCEKAPYEIYSTKWLNYDEIIILKAVDDVFERYYNSGRFYKTLDAAVCNFSSPFEFYLKLAEYWDNHGLVGQGVKRISLYTHLYEFLKDELDENKLSDVIRVMKQDFSDWHSNGIGTPEWYKMY